VTMPPGTGASAPSCYRHPGRETHLRCTRCERYICPDCMVPASVGFQCPECVKDGSRNVRQARTAAGAIIRPIGTPVVTYTIIALNVMVFGLQQLAGGTLQGTDVTSSELRLGVMAKFVWNGQPIGIANGEWYRLFTAMWLHVSVTHLFMNMLSLFFIGPMLEQLVGRLRFAVVYVVTGLAGAASSYVFMSELSGPSVGASGAIAGIFGCLIVIGLRRKILAVPPIVVVLALNVYLTWRSPEIDWHAHVGGLAAGVLIGAVVAFAPELLRAFGRLNAPRDQQIKLLNTLQATAVVVVLAAAVGMTAVHTSSLNDPSSRKRSSSLGVQSLVTPSPQPSAAAGPAGPSVADAPAPFRA
jgi:membrane associated rhomboid family serine protease